MSEEFLKKEIEEVEKDVKGAKESYIQSKQYKNTNTQKILARKYHSLKTKLQTLKECQEKHKKFVEKLNKYVDCMNPKHCGCQRCPNCQIFYKKLKDKLSSEEDLE